MEKLLYYYSTHSKWGKWVHAFTKDINSEGSIIVQREFELADYYASVQQDSHCIRWEVNS